MEGIGKHVFFFAPAWLTAVFCFAIAGANIYKSYTSPIKVWPRRLKSVNWLVLGGVFVYMFFRDFSYTDTDLTSRILTTIAIAFLIFGEAAYHADTFQDMLDSALSLVKRVIKHG